jgi:hypothetical protein
MDPREYLPLARALAQPEADEAALRTAAACAYEAAFRRTVQVLVSRGALPLVRSVQDHQSAVVALRQRKGYRVIGDLLDALRLVRVHADEELDRAFTLVEARRALALADLVLARVEPLAR